MSADNWGICPKCHAGIKPKKSLYGKIPEEEYLKKIAEPIAEEAQTLREDYEIYTDQDGYFNVTYSCRCSACGFNHKFEHTEDIFP